LPTDPSGTVTGGTVAGPARGTRFDERVATRAATTERVATKAITVAIAPGALDTEAVGVSGLVVVRAGL
jgi:hypothetical protein